MSLTKPQRRLLYRVQTAGTLTLNSRARSMAEALQKAGLISIELAPRHGCYPSYIMTALKCEHGRLLSHNPMPNPSCDKCEEQWYASREELRCPTCGRLP